MGGYGEHMKSGNPTVIVGGQSGGETDGAFAGTREIDRHQRALKPKLIIVRGPVDDHYRADFAGDHIFHG